MNRGELNEHLDLDKRFGLLCAVLAIACLACAARELQALSLSGIVAMVAVVCAVCMFLLSVAHYTLFEPLRELLAMAKAIRSHDFTKRLGFDHGGDIGKLALEMDMMCAQLQDAQSAADAHIAALEQLRHSDRVATLGRLASSVAHELGNPLNVIELRAQLIASGDIVTLHHAQQSAAVILEQTRRMTQIINEILSFARRQPARITRFDLVSLVRKAIVLCEHTSQKRGTSIQLDAPATTIEIDGDGDKLLQIIVNLVMNGVQAMPRGGTLDLQVREKSCAPAHDPNAAPREYLCIDVTDHGVGIPPNLVSKIFDPFYSTKVADGGTGLGLSVAMGIAQEHEGWISVDSELGRGSSFKVHLPKFGRRSDEGASTMMAG